MSCWDRTKHNFAMIKEGFQTKELRNSFIYFLLAGAVVPRYDDYLYFYLTDEEQGVGFSKMTYAYTKMASFIGIFIGAFVFVQFLYDWSIRRMMVLACVINFIASCGQVAFLLGFYGGMKPAVFYSLVELISDSFSQAFLSMPAMALVAKLIPSTIESALFAFFTGLQNLTYHFIGRILGNIVNEFFGVSKENIKDLWKLMAI